jgi:hypothetical protein
MLPSHVDSDPNSQKCYTESEIENQVRATLLFKVLVKVNDTKSEHVLIQEMNKNVE